MLAYTIPLPIYDSTMLINTNSCITSTIAALVAYGKSMGEHRYLCVDVRVYEAFRRPYALTVCL